MKARGCQMQTNQNHLQGSECLIKSLPNAGISAKHLIDIIRAPHPPPSSLQTELGQKHHFHISMIPKVEKWKVREAE